MKMKKPRGNGHGESRTSQEILRAAGIRVMTHQWDTTVDLSPVQPPEKGPQPADQVSERILPVDGGGVEVPPLRDGEGLPSPVKNEDETPKNSLPNLGVISQ